MCRARRDVTSCNRSGVRHQRGFRYFGHRLDRLEERADEELPTLESYLPWNPEQSYLLPPSPRDWLPEGHLAYFILDVVKLLDLSAIIKSSNPTLPWTPRTPVAKSPTRR